MTSAKFKITPLALPPLSSLNYTYDSGIFSFSKRN